MSDPRAPTAARPTEPGNGELVNRVQQIRLDAQLGRRPSGGGTSWLPWVLCALLALAWAGVAVRSYKNAPDRDAGSAGSSAGATGPSAAAPADAAVAIPPVKGYLIPARQIAVSPIDVGGRVVELNFVEGGRYEKGFVLAKLDDASYRAARDEAAALLASAKQRKEGTEQRYADLQGNANPPPGSVRGLEIKQLEAQIKEADAQQRKAQDEVNRLEGLTGARSGREWVQSQIDVAAAAARRVKLETDLTLLKLGARPEKLKAAEAEVSAAAADVKAAEARLHQAQWRVDNCTITAPITGTVLTKKAEMGNLANPMAFSASTSGGGAVCDMADLADLEVELEIPEREIARLRVGQPCKVRADAYQDRTYEGRLDRIMPIAIRANSTVKVRVKVALPPGEVPGTHLKPEMGAVVTFLPMTEGEKK
ncbi:MAG TPA: efflux RND transporter periplasmic adaptor subunit [Fimbriiglobus sp.]|nr:efflux RND transporter periplasmic adaptor subunit [Fimbriiglobus sp.]